MSKPSLLAVIKSVIAAFVGIQTDKNRKKDFSQGSLPTYIAVALIATLLFIFVLAKFAAYVVGN